MFEKVSVNDDELRRKVHELRYQVYVVERGFESPTDHPNGLERDSYDDQSAHTLLVDAASGRLAGTVRLILTRPECPWTSLPIHRVSNDPVFLGTDCMPIQRLAEVSRFCISRDFRRTCAGEPGQGGLMLEGPAAKVFPYMMIDLIGALVRMSVENNITYWCAVMEPQLLRLLKWVGIHFEPIGPLIDYHGKRQPCLKHLPTLLDRVRDEKPAIWDAITDQGELVERLEAIDRQDDLPMVGLRRPGKQSRSASASV